MPALTWRGERLTFPSFEALALQGSAGASWYLDSGATLARYARELGTSTKRVCDIVAILSPRVSVSRNVAMAQSYLEHGVFLRGTMRARIRAVERYEETGVFTGPKVVAFSRALQGDADAVVVDAWIARVFSHKSSMTARQYQRLADRVRRLASRMGLYPFECQAMLWVGARQLTGHLDPVSPMEVKNDGV